MSYKPNAFQQITLEDSVLNLTKRERKFLENSWAPAFADYIFPLIDEDKFSCLYSDKASRPNTPVNVCVGALILKELFSLSDDEIVESLMFDIRFQYALHTTSFDEQPLSDKTLSRFRRRCYEYELETGIDLIHDTITSLGSAMAKMMNINGRIQRMDSIMVESNIKRLSRMELLYTCISNFVRYLHKNGKDDILEGFEHYYDPSDYNAVIYHQRNNDYAERLRTIIADGEKLLEKCSSGYDDVRDYQNLKRAFSEQTIKDGDTLRLRTSEDGGMDSEIMQNPSDPEATFREKAGEEHRGYVANVTEESWDGNSIITDYQFDKNTRSDSDLLKEHLEKSDKPIVQTTLVTDGAYCGSENTTLAEEKNVKLVPTSLTGRKTPDINADYIFSEDHKQILMCPNGCIPISSGYIKSTGKVRATYGRHTCECCPFKDQCNPKIGSHVSSICVSFESSARAQTQRYFETWEYKFLAKFRNGVETIPSVLRRCYGIDRMPVRGLIRMKHLFGIKIGAVNFRKLLKYKNSSGLCTLNLEIA
jgi:hypothetical protein